MITSETIDMIVDALKAFKPTSDHWQERLEASAGFPQEEADAWREAWMLVHTWQHSTASKWPFIRDEVRTAIAETIQRLSTEKPNVYSAILTWIHLCFTDTGRASEAEEFSSRISREVAMPPDYGSPLKGSAN